MLREIKDFMSSWVCIWEVFRYLSNNPKSLLWILIPLLINILVMLGSLYLAFMIMEAFFPISWPSLEWTLAAFSAYAEALGSNIVNLLLTMGCFLSLYVLGFSIFCSFVYGLMVEKIEKKLGVEPDEFKSVSISRQILDSVLIALLFLIGNIVIFSFNILPLVGTVFAMLSAVAFQSFCLGMEFFDFSMALRGKSFKDKLRYFKTHPGEVLGVGNISWFFMMIPILNSCLFTFSILVATFRYRRRRINTMCDQVFGDHKVELITRGSDVILSANQLEKQGSFFGSSDQLTVIGDQLVYLAKSKKQSTLIQWTAKGETILRDNMLPV